MAGLEGIEGKGKYLHWNAGDAEHEPHLEMVKRKPKTYVDDRKSKHLTAFDSAQEIFDKYKNNELDKKLADDAINYISNEYDKKTAFIYRKWSVKKLFTTKNKQESIRQTKRDFIGLLNRFNEQPEAEGEQQGSGLQDLRAAVRGSDFKNSDVIRAAIANASEILLTGAQERPRADSGIGNKSSIIERVIKYYTDDISRVPDWWLERHELDRWPDAREGYEEAVKESFTNFMKTVAYDDEGKKIISDATHKHYTSDEIDQLLNQVINPGSQFE